MNRLIYRVKQWGLILSLPIMAVACSDVSMNEGSGISNQSLGNPSVAFSGSENSNQKNLLGQLSSVIESIRDSQHHDEPLTEKELAEINEMLSKIKEMENDPEAVRQVKSLESDIAELKGIDQSQISFDTRFLK